MARGSCYLAWMSESAEPAEALAQARALIDVLGKDLPKVAPIAAFAPNTRIPFKAFELRELYRYRVLSLGVPSVEFFEQGRNLPAVVLARAAFETVAPLFCLHKEIAKFLSGPRDEASVKVLDEFLLKSLMASRRPDSQFKATSIVTLIQKVEKEMPGLEKTYDDLCEYAHPNWAGVLGSFGEGNAVAGELRLGERPDDVAAQIGGNALAGAFGYFHHLYNELAELLVRLNDHFEPGSKHVSTV